VPVSGVVTYGGQPVANVNVTFLGADGAVATGVTDAQGQFTRLSPNRPGDGALPGDYKVTITPKSDVAAEPSGPIDYQLQTGPPFPVKYMTLEASDLTATVTAGAENNFTFELVD
jgi:hypothetical protein